MADNSFTIPTTPVPIIQEPVQSLPSGQMVNPKIGTATIEVEPTARQTNSIFQNAMEAAASNARVLQAQMNTLHAAEQDAVVKKAQISDYAQRRINDARLDLADINAPFKDQEQIVYQQLQEAQLRASELERSKPSVLNFPAWVVNRVQHAHASNVVSSAREDIAGLEDTMDFNKMRIAQGLHEVNQSTIIPAARLVDQQLAAARSKYVAIAQMINETTKTNKDIADFQSRKWAVALGNANAGASARKEADLNYLTDAYLYTHNIPKSDRTITAARAIIEQTFGIEGGEEARKAMATMFLPAYAAQSAGINLPPEEAFRHFANAGGTLGGAIVMSQVLPGGIPNKYAPAITSAAKTYSTQLANQNRYNVPAYQYLPKEIRDNPQMVASLTTADAVRNAIATNATDPLAEQHAKEYSEQQAQYVQTQNLKTPLVDVAKSIIEATAMKQHLNANGQDIALVNLTAPSVIEDGANIMGIPAENLAAIIKQNENSLAGPGNPQTGLIDRLYTIRSAVRSAYPQVAKSKINDWLISYLKAMQEGKTNMLPEIAQYIDLLGGESPKYDVRVPFNMPQASWWQSFTMQGAGKFGTLPVDNVVDLSDPTTFKKLMDAADAVAERSARLQEYNAEQGRRLYTQPGLIR